METLYAIIIICFAIIIYILIYMMRKMAKLKKQNDRIYENKLNLSEKWSEGTTTDWADMKAEEIDCDYDFEFESSEIEEIDMSFRLRHCLDAAEIERLSQLENYTKKELLGFRNFGRKSLAELENLMNKHNLEFKKDKCCDRRYPIEFDDY